MTTPAFVDDATVEVDTISKWFGQKVAVSNVSCSFGPGITGLLGPNGAGKTTLLRLMAGLAVPSQGGVQVMGDSPRKNTRIYQNVGLVPEDDAVYEFLTGRQFVEYSATLARVRSPNAAAARTIAAVELEDAADRQIGGYSKGMRQRIKVAAALVHDPQILFLDEPLNGADPVQRAKLIDLFHRLAADGRTLVVSSHVLAEVERMTKRVIAMVDGRLAAAGQISAIRAALSDIPYKVRIVGDDLRRLGAALLTREVVRSVEVDEKSLEVQTEDLGELGRALPRLTSELDMRLTLMQPEDLSLESLFRYLVHRRR